MNITFLIGNGFDRNLGLKTTYSDFIQHYRTVATIDADISHFKDDIDSNQELWADAEIQIGKYTEQFARGEGVRFAKCHEDFCTCLAAYLKGQEQRINYEANRDAILNAFGSVNELYNSFPARERDAIREAYRKNQESQIIYRFICFNYTHTLDKCLDIVKQNKQILGSHKVGATTYSHAIGSVSHVHGTVDGNMVFGVNDDSQISRHEIFDCEYGDIYKSQIVKKDTNASYQENADEIAVRLLNDSHIIYIYGMSIGDTDKLWWERVCRWLTGNADRHVIVHKFSMPQKGAISMAYQIAEREHKRLLLSKSTLSDELQKSVEQRIHITDSNLFQRITGIADPTEEEQQVLFQLELQRAMDEVEKEATIQMWMKQLEDAANGTPIQ